MKLRCGRLLAALCLLGAVAHSQPARPFTPAEYVQVLARVRERVAELRAKPQTAPAVEAALPKSWKVRAGDGAIDVTTDRLRAGLEAFLKAPPKEKAARQKALDGSLQRMQAQAQAYQAAAPHPAELHHRLEEILSTPEFRGLRGPTWFQLLIERIAAWLQKKMRQWLPEFPVATEAGPVFAWCVIAVVCAALALWFYRRSRATELQWIPLDAAVVPSSKDWSDWLAEARASAGREQWREAIHLAFWASVSKLEDEGCWPPSRARTPREYLRAIPEQNRARPAFQSLMRCFERSWYGGRAASGDDFQQALVALERMGCR